MPPVKELPMTLDRAVTSRVTGSVRVADGEGIVRIEALLGASIGVVWAAFVEPARRSSWLGTFEGDLRTGGAFDARFLSSGWQGTGRVDVCQPLERLKVSLTQADDAGVHAMEVTLRAVDGRTAFVVEERGIPREMLAAYGAGVQVHVEDLMAHLAGGERCDAIARWKALFPSWQAMPVDAE